jgi:hypothetical protein
VIVVPDLERLTVQFQRWGEDLSALEKRWKDSVKARRLDALPKQ